MYWKMTTCAGLFLGVCGMLALTGFSVGDGDADKEKKAEPPAAVKAKPLSDNVEKGLKWLVERQHDDGGWGQEGGWRLNSNEGKGAKGGGRVETADHPSDVGNTAITVLALLRAGHTPKEGKYAKNVAKGIDFICQNVDKADKDTLYVTTRRDTQLQSKIGPYVDTFLASMALAESKGKMQDDDAEKRLLASAEKTIHKMEKNQKKDGSWSDEGWASIVSQGMATKGLNRMNQSGLKVQNETLTRSESYARGNFKDGKFGGKGGDAGVQLYSAANTAGAAQDSVNGRQEDKRKAEEVVKAPAASPSEKAEAQRELDEIGNAEKEAKVQGQALAKEVQNEKFVKGFGNNGGEEFLSFMNISETLVAQGGKNWEEWDAKATKILNECQDKDGSWSGHHCITGKTFCTSAALLTLMADRAPVQVAAKMVDDTPKK